MALNDSSSLLLRSIFAIQAKGTYVQNEPLISVFVIFRPHSVERPMILVCMTLVPVRPVILVCTNSTCKMFENGSKDRNVLTTLFYNGLIRYKVGAGKQHRNQIRGPIGVSITFVLEERTFYSQDHGLILRMFLSVIIDQLLTGTLNFKTASYGTHVKDASNVLLSACGCAKCVLSWGFSCFRQTS